MTPKINDQHSAVEIVKPKKVNLIHLFLVFLYLGSTVFGGMWAATNKLEKVIVDQEKWMRKEELEALLLTSAIIPAPKFLSLSGLIGYHLQKSWLGTITAILGLFTPPSLLVLLGVILINPSLLEGPLAPVNKSIGIVVIGILIGNAIKQIKGSKGTKTNRIKGLVLCASLFLFWFLGLPLLVTAILGFVLGAFFIQEK